MNENSTERKRRRKIGKGSNRLTTKYYCNGYPYMAFDNISSQIFLVQITSSFEKKMSDATICSATILEIISSRGYNLALPLLHNFSIYPKIQEYE